MTLFHWNSEYLSCALLLLRCSVVYYIFSRFVITVLEKGSDVKVRRQVLE